MDDLGFERGGRLHGHKREQLHHVVLHHVAEGARLVVVAAPTFDAQRFGHCDLHVVDVFLVPERFENLVGKPQGKDVLDGLLAEVVVDAEDMLFVEDIGQHVVQFLRGGQAAAEGLFHDDALSRTRT